MFLGSCDDRRNNLLELRGFRLFNPSKVRMERIAGRAVEEAREQAEILAAALRTPDEADARFLLAHAQHLLACCREIADSRLN